MSYTVDPREQHAGRAALRAGMERERVERRIMEAQRARQDRLAELKDRVKSQANTARGLRKRLVERERRLALP